jgi:hypothetical protein
MRGFLTAAGRWICIVAVALLASRIARGDDAADVNVDFTLGIVGLPQFDA